MRKVTKEELNNSLRYKVLRSRFGGAPKDVIVILLDPDGWKLGAGLTYWGDLLVTEEGLNCPYKTHDNVLLKKLPRL